MYCKLLKSDENIDCILESHSIDNDTPRINKEKSYGQDLSAIVSFPIFFVQLVLVSINYVLGVVWTYFFNFTNKLKTT